MSKTDWNNGNKLEISILMNNNRLFLYTSLEYLRVAIGKKIFPFFEYRKLSLAPWCNVIPLSEIEQGLQQDAFTMEELVKKVSILFWYWGCLSEPIAQYLPLILGQYILEYYEEDSSSGIFKEAMKSLPGMPDVISMIQRRDPEKDATPWKSNRYYTVSREISELRRLIDNGMKDLEPNLQKRMKLLKEYETKTMDSSLIDYLEEKTTGMVNALFTKRKYEFRMVLTSIPSIEI
tara:strand:+ start:93 stop:794 length:702 start_codon:yes stop_codon:yes gene_type:complete